MFSIYVPVSVHAHNYPFVQMEPEITFVHTRTNLFIDYGVILSPGILTDYHSRVGAVL